MPKKTCEGFCRICGIILENVTEDTRICKDIVCFRINQNRRRRKARALKKLGFINYQQQAKGLSEDRPWTIDQDKCLFDRIKDGESIEYISKDINRRKEDVINRVNYLECRGIESIQTEWLAWSQQG